MPPVTPFNDGHSKETRRRKRKGREHKNTWREEHTMVSQEEVRRRKKGGDAEGLQYNDRNRKEVLGEKKR
jgi:hypothetical protein